jgi:hypothetical protein
MRIPAIVLSLFLAAGGVGGEEETATLSSSGEYLLVSQNGRQGRIPLGDVLEGRADFESRELYRRESEGSLYLLLEVQGRSRDNDGSGQCGAGVEMNLLHVQLNEDLSLRDLQSELIHSCWRNRYPEHYGGLKERESSVEVTFSEKERLIHVAFDKTNPESGLQILRLVPPETAPPAFISLLTPGESRVLRAARDLQLTVQPSTDAAAAEKAVIPKGELFQILGTVFYVIQPGIVRVLEDTVLSGRALGRLRLLSEEEYYDPRHSLQSFALEAGDRLEELQYRGEGYSLVRFEGQIYEVDELGSAFEWESPLAFDWWAEFIDEDRTRLGWVHITEDAVE